MFQYLYVSALAAGCDAAVVSEIIQTSREHNPRNGIGGALVFDGDQFAQLLRGEKSAVLALARRICADPRHTQLVVLLEGEAERPAAQTPTGWLAGYCEPDQLPALRAMAGSAPDHVIVAFQRLLAAADMA